MSYSQKARNFLGGLLIFFIMIITGTSCSSQPIPSDQSAVENITESITISFSVSAPLETDYEILATEFHRENPSITVDIVALPEDQASGTNENLYQLASSADTTFLDDYNLLINSADYFRDLSPLIESDSSFEQEDFWKGVFSGCQDPEDRVLGIPFNLQFTGVYFDPTAFETAGLPTPSPGWTWDNFSQAVSALTRTDGDKVRYGFVDSPILWNQILTPMIDDTLVKSNGQINAEMLENEIQWYTDLVRAGSLYAPSEPANQSNGQGQWEALFTDQPPAMWIGNLGFVLSEGLAIENYGIAPFPVNASDPTTNTTPFRVTCGVISAGTKQPQAAWTWLSFLTRQPLPKSGFTIPARPSVADKYLYWETLPAKALPAVRFGLDHAWYGSSYPLLLQSVNQALIQVLNSEDGTNFTSALENRPTIATPEQSRNTPVAVATPQPTVDSAGDTIVIKYLAPDILQGETVYKALVEEFHRTHPEITVRISHSFIWSPEKGDYFTLLANNFDCFVQIPFLENENIKNLYSLNPLLVEDGNTFKNDFYTSQMGAFMVDGELYGLPSNYQPQVIYYNADIITQSGLEIPRSDWSFDDFTNLIEATSTGTDSDHVYGFAGSIRTISEGLFPLWDALLADPFSVNFDSPEMVVIANQLADLVQRGIVFPTTDWETLNQLITSQRVVFWRDFAELDATSDYGFAKGFVPFPTLPGYKWPGGGLLSGQFISSQSTHPQACWAWMKFLSEQPYAFSGIPARRSVVQSSTWETSVGIEKAEVYRVTLEQTNEYNSFLSQIWGPVYGFWETALASIFDGIDSTQALTETQRQVDAYLECINKLNLSGTNDQDLLEKVGGCYTQAYETGVGP